MLLFFMTQQILSGEGRNYFSHLLDTDRALALTKQCVLRFEGGRENWGKIQGCLK